MLEVLIKRESNRCPFENNELVFQIDPGECLWIQGMSGAGKTSIAKHLTGISPLEGANVSINWESEKDQKENPIGMLFQQGVLIDSLNLEENIALSCKAAEKPHDKQTILKQILEVDLKEQDLYKMPGELSGGMLRRAALAQILAQKKKLIILDEPFVGLDPETTGDVVKVLNELKAKGIAFILISHQEEFCSSFVTPGKVVKLKPKKYHEEVGSKRKFAHWRQGVRVLLRLGNYLGISFPLIFCAFFAAGLAMSMLFAQMLKQTDVQTIMKEFGSKHTSLLMRFFGHEFARMGAKYLPIIKEKVYIAILTKGFVIELGPLLTALLLAGRIGGSYSGEVGMMQATNQNYLLKTLGKNPRSWNLLPATIAALIAAPILTAFGTIVALVVGGWVGLWQQYGILPSFNFYWEEVIKKVFFTYPNFWNFLPFVNIYRSIGFMIVILLVAEFCGRFRKNLQPRDVPQAITWAVVTSSVLIIILDWGFSQLIHF